MRFIFPGAFLMGSPEDEPERVDDEDEHEVTLTKGFWLGVTQVTQAFYEAVTGKNSSHFQGQDQPVERVSWEDAWGMTRHLNSVKPGLALRLPTEAEWEYACRAGTTTPFHFGSNITTDQVNYRGTAPYNNGEKGEYRGQTVEVNALPGNAWGLRQMHGNVWEWCEDWYGEYSGQSQIDPQGPESGSNRVIRGGSWLVNGRDCRSASRYWWGPSFRRWSLGFRLAAGPFQ
jgi:formylglycine-generating enzyme required for sulfatase activity